MTKDEFIKRMEGSVYSYDKVPAFFRTLDKVAIQCRKHGEFRQAVYGHLRGQGCPSCRGTRPYTTEEFIDKIKPFCKGVAFDKTVYVKGTSPVTLTCLEHGDYQVVPRTLLNNKSGNGCLKCKSNACTGGYNYKHLERDSGKFSKMGFVYLNKLEDINGQVFYKIGITINDPKGRTKLYKPHKLLTSYSTPVEIGYAYYIEQSVLDCYKEYRYTPSVKIAGQTECLSINPIPNIKEIIDELHR